MLSPTLSPVSEGQQMQEWLDQHTTRAPGMVNPSSNQFSEYRGAPGGRGGSYVMSPGSGQFTAAPSMPTSATPKTDTQLMSPGMGTYSPTMSPRMDSATRNAGQHQNQLRNLAGQRLGQNAALSSLPSPGNPALSAGRNALMARNQAFAERILAPGMGAGNPTAATPASAKSMAPGNVGNLYKSMIEFGGLTHEQAIDALNKPPFTPASTPTPGMGATMTPYSSPRYGNGQAPAVGADPVMAPGTLAPTSHGTITVGPGWQQFAGESRATLYPSMTPGQIGDSVQRDFTDLVKGEKANVKTDRGYLNKTDIAEAADMAQKAAGAQRAGEAAAGQKVPTLHRMPVADGSGYAPYVNNLGETFVHTGGGGYESDRGRVMRVGPDGKQIGEVSQGPRPQSLGIKWTPQLQRSYDAIHGKTSIQPQQERAGSSGTQAIGSPTPQDVPEGGQLLNGKNGAMMQFRGRNYTWGTHPENGQVGWVAQ